MASAAQGYRVFDDETRTRLAAVREELARANALAQKIPGLEQRLADQQIDAPGAPYRAENVTELRRELEEARAARGERRKLRLEESSLMRAIEHERRMLEARGMRRITLPVLDNVEIASPCDMSWADMEGDTDVRHCGKCAKDVLNLSMMTREEAEAVLHVSEGKDLCVRVYRRDDGTVLTQDCPVGARRQRFWRRTRGVASAGLIAAGLGMMAMHYLASKCVARETTAGALTTLPN